MNGHGIRYISYESEKEVITNNVYARKTRETYISPPKDNRSSKEVRGYGTSPARNTRAEAVVN